MNLIAQWNDEENSRQVQFAVAYSIEDKNLSIETVIPTKVTFLDPQTQIATRSIGVHTSRGQQMLNGQLKSSGQFEVFRAEIDRRSGLALETIS